MQKKHHINNQQSQKNCSCENIKPSIQAFCLGQMGQTKRAMTELWVVQQQSIKQATVGGVAVIHNDAAPMKNFFILFYSKLSVFHCNPGLI